MNLKENYERFFGKINQEPKQTNKTLTSEQKTRFINLSHQLKLKYPNAPLTLKEGFVWMGNKKVEQADKFLNRSAMQIQEMVRSFSNSGKRGLI
jgi:hypothetical protein